MNLVGDPAAYRGYRLQALYTLRRMLVPGADDSLEFQPEGHEDLAIWDANNHLVETIQVKAHKNLALSGLSPTIPDSFLHRAVRVLSEPNPPVVKLVNIWPIGPELRQTWEAEEPGRGSVSSDGRCSARRGRRSIRLPGWDYRQAGAYFVTLCTIQGSCLFGQVEDSQVILNQYGHIVQEDWLRTPQVRPHVDLDVFVIMPNHIHGIIWIVDQMDKGQECIGAVGAKRRFAPTRLDRFEDDTGSPTEEIDRNERGTSGSPPGSLSAIIQQVKSNATRRINQLRSSPGQPVWQRNYYEHVIRSQRALDAIRQYIVNNPARWAMDRYNPDTICLDPQAAELWRLLREDGTHLPR